MRNPALHEGAEFEQRDIELAWAAAARLLDQMKNCLRLHNDLNVVAEMLAAWGMGSDPPSLKQPLPVVLPWC